MNIDFKSAITSSNEGAFLLSGKEIIFCNDIALNKFGAVSCDELKKRCIDDIFLDSTVSKKKFSEIIKEIPLLENKNLLVNCCNIDGSSFLAGLKIIPISHDVNRRFYYTILVDLNSMEEFQYLPDNHLYNDSNDPVVFSKLENNEAITSGRLAGDLSGLDNLQGRFLKQINDLKRNIIEKELELKKTNSLFKDTLNSASIYTWKYNPQEKIFDLPGAVLKFFNTERSFDERVVIDKKSLKNLFSQVLLRKLENAFHNLNALKDPDKVIFIEETLGKPDGNYIYLNFGIKINLSKERNVEGYFGTVQNITKLISAHEEKKRLNEIIEATPDIVAILDHHLNLVYLNRSGKSFFGFDNPLPHKKLLYYFENNNILQKGLKEALKKGVWEGENLIEGSDNKKLAVSIVIVAHRRAQGEIFYSIIFRDISKRRSVEDNLRKMNKELDNFIYRASHDLRGPIASMLGLYNVVQKDIREKNALQYFSFYQEQVIKLNNIVLALIKLTNIKDRKSDVGEYQVKEMICDTVSSFSYLPEFKNINFETDIPDKLVYSGDFTTINTVFHTLIDNAIKFSVPVENPSINISVKTVKNNEIMMISIQDNGIGIPDEIHDKIFDMFYRGHPTATGNGLGLYLLKNAVDKLNGTIELSSAKHQGAHFLIKIPLRLQVNIN